MKERGTGAWRPWFAAPLPAVDEVALEEQGGGWRLRTTKRVTVQDPYMAGHFPGLTMLPAVFLLEGLRQSVSCAFPAQAPMELLEIRSARLRAPMLGDQVVRVDALAQQLPDESVWALRARCTTDDGRPVANLAVHVGGAGPDRCLDLLGGALSEVPGRRDLTAGPGAMNHAQIRELLPLGHPMLLVDRVAAVVPGKKITALKAVTGGELCYQSLPPDATLSSLAYPRTLVLESFGQTAALLWLASAVGNVPQGVLMLAAIRDCHFAGTVLPGDVLVHVAQLEQLVAGSAFLSGSTWVGDRCVATVGALIAVQRPAGVVGPHAS